MTKTQELLELARVELGDVTDYKLAQIMEIPRTTMHEMTHGRMNADAYAATRIALALNKDPLEVIASIEAENANTPAKRAFWESFPGGLRRTALGLALFLTFGSSGVGWPGGAVAGNTSHNVGIRQRPERRKAPRGAFFNPAVSRN